MTLTQKTARPALLAALLALLVLPLVPAVVPAVVPAATPGGTLQEQALTPQPSPAPAAPPQEQELQTRVQQEPSLARHSLVLDGVGEEWVTDVELMPDGSGRSLLCGYTKSADFPTTPAANKTTPAGGGATYEAWVAIVSEDGDLLASTYYGGDDQEYAYAVAANSSGYVYVAGHTSSGALDNFPTTPDALDSSYNGNLDGFLAIFSPDNLSDLVYSTYVGGDQADRLYDMVIDSNDMPWVVGTTLSTNWPTAGTPMNATSNGNKDGVLLAFGQVGGLHYSTHFGGSGDDEARSLALRSSTSLGYARLGVGMATDSTDLPTTSGAYDRTHGGGDGGAFALLEHSTDPAWTGVLTYCSYLGEDLPAPTAPQAAGDADTYYYMMPSVAWHSQLSAYALAASASSSSTVPVTPGATQLSGAGGWDGYVSVLRPGTGSSTDLLFATLHGGSADEHFRACLVGGQGDLLALGSTRSSDYPVAGETAEGKSGSSYRDVAIARWTQPASFAATLNFSSAVTTGEDWAEAQSAALLEVWDDPLAAITSTPGSASEQEVVHAHYTLPTTPLASLLTRTIPNDPGETFRLVVNATAAPGYESYTGSAVSSVVLTVEDDEGDEHQRWGYQDPLSPDLWEVRMKINSSGLYTWLLEATSEDGGVARVDSWTNATSEIQVGENVTTGGISAAIAAVAWGIQLSDYVWYAFIALMTALVLYSMGGKELRQAYKAKRRRKAHRILASEVMAGVLTTVLAGVWSWVELTLVWVGVAVWGYAVVRYEQRGLTVGVAVAFGALGGWSLLTGASYWYAVAYFVVAGGAGVASIDFSFKVRGADISLERIGTVVQIVGAVVAIIVAVLPLFAPGFSLTDLVPTIFGGNSTATATNSTGAA